MSHYYLLISALASIPIVVASSDTILIDSLLIESLLIESLLESTSQRYLVSNYTFYRQFKVADVIIAHSSPFAFSFHFRSHYPIDSTNLMKNHYSSFQKSCSQIFLIVCLISSLILTLSSFFAAMFFI